MAGSWKGRPSCIIVKRQRRSLRPQLRHPLPLFLLAQLVKLKHALVCGGASARRLGSAAEPAVGTQAGTVATAAPPKASILAAGTTSQTAPSSILRTSNVALDRLPKLAGGKQRQQRRHSRRQRLLGAAWQQARQVAQAECWDEEGQRVALLPPEAKPLFDCRREGRGRGRIWATHSNGRDACSGGCRAKGAS